MATSQLTLDLPVQPRLGCEDFLVSACNEAAFGIVDLWPNWPGRVMLLVGAAGAGKSHLAAIWSARSGARLLGAQDLAADNLFARVDAGAFLLEDADRIGVGEAALFHLLNIVRESGASLLLTAREPPDGWSLRTPDLLSRLRLAPSTQIDPPDDELMRAVMAKLVIDRQLGIDAGVVDYLANRIERSLAAVRSIVSALDQESLAQGRRITKVMAGEVLRRLA